jgi:DNA-binding NarL/FixJ family response regulator
MDAPPPAREVARMTMLAPPRPRTRTSESLTRRLRVVAADDHSLVLLGVCAALADAPDLELVDTARSGTELLTLVARTHPDVVLLDLHMPGRDGLSCLDRIREDHPDVRVVMFSSTDDERVIADALSRGASAYVVKSVNPRDLPFAIRQAVEGHVHLNLPASAFARDTEVAQLSERETSVLRLLARGLSNRQIARELWVTEQTVKFHLTNIYRKLGVANRTEAARLAFARGVTSQEGRR